MIYYARSATETTPRQPYMKHVLHVLVRGRCYLRKILCYAQDWDAKAICRIYELAAEYHDLGKLDDENQNVLAGDKKASRLPVPGRTPLPRGQPQPPPSPPTGLTA